MYNELVYKISKPNWYVLYVMFLVVPISLAAPVGISDQVIYTGEQCAALPAPSGDVVNVASLEELLSAVGNLSPNTTILIADGIYHLHGAYLWIDTNDVTLRSASGNREAVILDGDYETTEIITIAASNVTIADLTIRRAATHPVHVVSTDLGSADNALIYNLHIVDPRQQAIKINPHEARLYFTDDGMVACSHIEMTDAGRTQVSGCYTGGVDAHEVRGWTIRDNLVEGFWCELGLSEHAIHMWRGSRDTLVERNQLNNNARGIGFGLDENGVGRTYADNPCPSAEGGYVGHYGGIVRNNFVFVNRSELFTSEYGFDCGICLWQACDARVLHNSVASTLAPFSSIEWRYDRSNIDIINNLVTHNLRDRGGTVRLSSNLEYQPLNVFVDGVNGDLHLSQTATDAINMGDENVADYCRDDFDRDLRPIDNGYDIGADEYGANDLIFLPVVMSH